MAAGVALGRRADRWRSPGHVEKLAHRTDDIRHLNRDERSAFPSGFGVWRSAGDGTWMRQCGAFIVEVPRCHPILGARARRISEGVARCKPVDVEAWEARRATNVPRGALLGPLTGRYGSRCRRDRGLTHDGRKLGGLIGHAQGVAAVAHLIRLFSKHPAGNSLDSRPKLWSLHTLPNVVRAGQLFASRPERQQGCRGVDRRWVIAQAIPRNLSVLAPVPAFWPHDDRSRNQPQRLPDRDDPHSGRRRLPLWHP
jgi:hypothetical protein